MANFHSNLNVTKSGNNYQIRGNTVHSDVRTPVWKKYIAPNTSMLPPQASVLVHHGLSTEDVVRPPEGYSTQAVLGARPARTAGRNHSQIV